MLEFIQSISRQFTGAEVMSTINSSTGTSIATEKNKQAEM